MHDNVVAGVEAWLRQAGMPALSRGRAGHHLLLRASPALAFLLAVAAVGNLAAGIWYRLPGFRELGFDAAMDKAANDGVFALVGLLLPVLAGIVAAALAHWAARRDVRSWSDWAPRVLIVLNVIVAAGGAGLAAWGLRAAYEELVLTLAVLAGVLLAVRTGVAAVLIWAARQACWNFLDVLRLASRALPLLLLFITFLFINTENWQVSAALNWPQLCGVAGFFLACMLLFLSAALPADLKRLTTVDPDMGLRDACADTPLEPIVDELVAHGLIRPRLRRLERLNLLACMVLQQVLQSLLLGAVIWAFFLMFGKLAIRDSVIESWTGRPPQPWVPFADIPELALPVSTQLVHVCVVIAAFSALYFAVTSVTDANYRANFLSDMLAEVTRCRLVREAYLTLLDMRAKVRS